MRLNDPEHQTVFRLAGSEDSAIVGALHQGVEGAQIEPTLLLHLTVALDTMLIEQS